MDSIDSKIETGLIILDEKEVSLIELKTLCSGLKISGIEDKAGFKAVREARLTLKDARVQIQKDGKALREKAIRFQKTVIERENQLIDIISPVEKELQQEEETYNSLVEQERVRKEREENARIQARVDALAKFGYAIDLYELKIMPDENYEALLGHAEAEWNKEQERIASEKADADRLKKEEEERMQRERGELVRQRAEQEKRNEELLARGRELQRQEAERLEAIHKQEEAIRIENERIRKEQEAKESEIRAEREKLEAEKRKIEEEKRLEAAQKEAAEKARIEEQNRIKREAEEKEERERKEKEKAARQEALKPDKDKLLSFAYIIHSIPTPMLNDAECREVLGYAIEKLQAVENYIKEQVSKL